ncbi:hypothetical protein JTB14_035673 [Gonioctena quinquepunctata]|nr:hypothetical protein JTB14_035673 [Gonioctena quinquepunctata]
MITNNRKSNLLNDIYSSRNFDLCNSTYPTREVNNSRNLLDHVVSNFNKTMGIPIINGAISYHKLIVTEVILDASEVGRKYYQRTLTKFKIAQVKEELKKLNGVRYHLNDPDDLYNEITKIFRKNSSKHTIKTEKKIKGCLIIN